MASPIKKSNIISNLAIAIYGDDSDAARATLKAEMYKHHRSITRPPITRQAIKRWIDVEGSAITRPKALWFIYDFLINSGLSLPTEKHRKQLVEQALMHSARFASVVKTSQPNVSTKPRSRQESGLARMIEYIKRSDAQSSRDMISDLFAMDGRMGDDRQSYFIVYRPSTTGGSVVKTFLVCKQPQHSFIDLCSFVNFVRGGAEFYPDVVREVQGVILRMEKSYYWIGYMYHVGQDALNAADYQLTRVQSKSFPRALEIITSEYDDLSLNRGLFPALIMTTAAMTQPVLSRAAILHVGDSINLQYYLNHDLIEPTELRLNDLSNDLILLMRRLNSIGCKRFGRVLERYFKFDDEEAAADKVAKLIIEMIDNAPLALKSDSLPDSFSAIESKPSRRGSGRPRP